MTKGIHQCECEICRPESDPVIVQQHRQMNLLLSRLNEAQRRWYVGTLSQQPGRRTANSARSRQRMRKQFGVDGGNRDRVATGGASTSESGAPTAEKKCTLEMTLLDIVECTAGTIGSQKWLNCRLRDIQGGCRRMRSACRSSVGCWPKTIARGNRKSGRITKTGARPTISAYLCRTDSQQHVGTPPQCDTKKARGDFRTPDRCGVRPSVSVLIFLVRLGGRCPMGSTISSTAATVCVGRSADTQPLRWITWCRVPD